MIASPAASESLITDARFAALREYVIAATGLCFYVSRAEAFAAQLARRLAQQGIADCGAYLSLLQDGARGEAELDKLIELLTIGETHFFRHREMFDALRDQVIPQVIEKNRTARRVRIWTAGCSIGAEPYSIAILLRHDFGKVLQGWNVSIVGTDINRRFLAQAAEGCFEEWAFRGTTPDFRREYFEQQGEKWQIRPTYREGVSFQCHNLARHAYPSLIHNLCGFDVILCRNVLIYFGDEVIQRVGRQMAGCLVEGGWLAVGHAEYSDKFSRLLDVVHAGGVVLYQKPFLGPAAAPWTPPDASRGLDASPSPVLVAPRESDLSTSAPATQMPLSGGSCAAERQESKTTCTTGTFELDAIRALADGGKLDLGLQRCESSIARDVLNPVYHFYHALLLEQVGRPDESVRALQRAIYLDRDLVLAHYYLALAQQKRGVGREAEKGFQNVLRLLAKRLPGEVLPDAEGLTVAELEEMTRMHISMLEGK